MIEEESPWDLTVELDQKDSEWNPKGASVTVLAEVLFKTVKAWTHPRWPH